ncbi:TonB-dependent receptor [Lunatibacter salilacus]|uniref:TonB-dependent receptor n=1 Tax=Lunatibacter salilacus TaxID=2483804 RepID=UPI00131D7650|nr:carboxypeptidase-like regulatory domain-containing protein [Lunatibacter salilacus]
MIQKILITALCAFGIAFQLYAQITQTIKGTVIDKSSGFPLPYANVIVLDTSPLQGTSTDSLGVFTIQNVPTGRYNLQISTLGYHEEVIREVLVESGKQTVLNITLLENISELGEVIVKPTINKQEALNPFSTVSSRMLSVEEASRYAGGFDDPARLASAFAGVASSTGTNGIIVRGNSPRYLQWRMEGVEIPDPNHFSNLRAFGGGVLTALSSQMLANSDFFTGAFPAEYNNALSGVFDMAMRKGNSEETERTIQLGLIGLEASQEGPFKKGGKATYLFNYRYSTLGLLEPVLPDNAESIKYQDLSFKLHFPTQKAGTFSLWGVGLIDGASAYPKINSSEWVYYDDKQEDIIRQYMAAAGLNHIYFLDNSSYIETTISTTASEVDWKTKALNGNKELTPFSNISNLNRDYSLATFVNKKFSPRHTNRTGVKVRYMTYDLQLNKAENVGDFPVEIVNTQGNSALWSAFSNSSIMLTNKLRMNMGLNGQLFALNNHFTIEPRLGLVQSIGEKQSIGLAYGLHSRLENLNFYFNNSLTTGEREVNKNLDFSKAHHFVLSYDLVLSENQHLKIEPYYQLLFDVPVIEGSSFSFINLHTDWFFAEKLKNSGEGRNYGIDLTMERFFSKGFYYLFTASIFDSKYKGGDDVWRNSRFNRNYVVNFLVGKEWNIGPTKQNTLSLNTRVTQQGGNRYSPVDVAATLARDEVVYDESLAFSQQSDPVLNIHFTVAYKKNKAKSSRELALKLINMTSQPDFYGFRYNFQTGGIDKDVEKIMIPNLSYKIVF